MHKRQNVNSDRDTKRTEGGGGRYERRGGRRHVERFKGSKVCHSLKWSRKRRKGNRDERHTKAKRRIKRKGRGRGTRRRPRAGRDERGAKDWL